MNKLVKLSLSSALFLISSSLFSQGGSTDIVFNMRTGTNQASVRSTLPQNNEIEYSPYLFDYARPTQIILFSGDTILGDFVYNIEFETLESLDKTASITWSEILSFEFSATEQYEKMSFSNLKLLWPSNEYGGFFQNVKSSPLVKVVNFLDFIPRSYNPSNQLGDLNDRIEKDVRVYLKVDNNWIECPESKTAFYDLFGMRSDDLRKYARKNKLKHTNPEDVGQMINWVIRK